MVRAVGLRRAYGSRVAVDGIDFEVREGECFGFLGPNGAGKSTTMRMLSCLTPRDSGELTVLGLDPDREPRALKRMLGVVAQDINLDLELTVRENLLVYARYFDVPRPTARERADRLLEFVQLGDRAQAAVGSLSGGMRRRLQIARALVNDPSLLLLDEPTTGLDPQARHLVWERLRELRGSGAALCITTHYMDEAAQLCDRLVIMDRGRIVRDGAPAELVRSVVGTHALELEAGSDVERLGAVLTSAGVRHHLRGPRVVAFGEPAALERLIRDGGVRPAAVVARSAGLEDVFLELTGHGLDEGAE